MQAAKRWFCRELKKLDLRIVIDQYNWVLIGIIGVASGLTFRRNDWGGKVVFLLESKYSTVKYSLGGLAVFYKKMKNKNQKL